MYAQRILTEFFSLPKLLGMKKLEDYIIQKVKQMRIDNNLSQQELADYINVSQSFIRDCEHPKRRAKYNINHLNELAKVFKCSFSDFFPDRPFENNSNISQ